MTARFASLLMLMALFVMAGCDRERFYDESASLANDSWHKDEPLIFKFTVEDTVSPYRFYLNVRNNTSYKYSNIYFFLTTLYPGNQMSRDTLEAVLADKDGTWRGKGTGRLRDNRILIRENLRFPRKGEYVLYLSQAMRDETLAGISEAGIRLELIQPQEQQKR